MSHGEPLVLESARRHPIDDDDILHTYRNAIRVIADDDIRIIIGAARNGLLLEIRVVVGKGPIRVIHAMRARRKYLRA